MAKAYPLVVEIIATEASTDGFIDDIITIYPVVAIDHYGDDVINEAIH